MAFADPADRRITRHLADMIEIERQHQGRNPHPGRGQRGFDTCMAGADHDYPEVHRGSDYGAQGAPRQVLQAPSISIKDRSSIDLHYYL